jgi:hypothetical protein
MPMARSAAEVPVDDSTPTPDAATGALQVHRAGDAGRAEVEQFIHDIYAQRYGADVRHFAPVLVSRRDAVDGRVVVAAGYRAAGHGPLFLERYLSAPVHTVLGDGTTPREGIVEVGHLAAGRAGEGRGLIGLLGPHLAAQGAQWVVGTLTEELRHLFVRLGITPLALGVADPDALGDDARHWGTYYDHRPMVLAGHLPLALQHLARRRAARRGQAA